MVSILRRSAVLVVLGGMWAALSGESSAAQLQRVSVRATDDDANHTLYDLASLRIFNGVVIKLKDSYVDPKRVDPKLMLVAALDAVEKQVAEVMVEGEAKDNKIKVTVGGQTRDFDIEKVGTLWQMSYTLKDIFEFIAKNLVTKDQDQREIEYAAVNGMLSTLDPHSILLKPDYFKEMKLQTKGEFGGLGFVIQMKEGNLTVVRVLKNTPAARSGIKPKDVIAKIGEESTVNMDLNDAVGRLRGKEGTPISITVRKFSGETAALTLNRAIIAIESVESKLLPDGIGWIKLKTFQGNSARDISAALDGIKAKSSTPLKGLILDLRGNPGGLLEQAIAVSDLFVSEGTIVTTVGYGEKYREVKKAHADESDSKLPLAVLVNSGSASASEIVAGALKNLNRAVIVGRQSFGKGSVQVLYDFPDESALKLTIAQYLTPGDLSIQEVGITPDFELTTARITKDQLAVWAPRKSMGEADLEHHLTNPADAKPFAKREDVINKDHPTYSLLYLRDEPKPDPKLDPKADPKKKGSTESVDLITPDDDSDDDVEVDGDKLMKDFQVSFAHDLLLAAPSVDRRKIIEQSRGFMAKQTAAQEDRIAKALGELGVTWNPAAANGQAKPQLVLEVMPGATQVTHAGETLQFTATLKNNGTTPVAALHAWTESENPYLDRREFVFGALQPGEKRSWTVPITMPKDLISRRDVVTFKVFSDATPVLDAVKTELNFSEVARPQFAYSAQVVDTCKDDCNGDGLTQKGETITLLVDVKNIGQGIAKDAYASIKNDADENVFIDKGRFKLGELAPGESKAATFQLQVKKGYVSPTYAIKLTLFDEPMEEYVGDRLVLPVGEAGTTQQARSGSVKLNAPTVILAAARAGEPAVATARAGAVLALEAKVGKFYRVAWEPGRSGFVPVESATESPAKAVTKKGDVEHAFQHYSPQIALNSIDPLQGGIQTESDKFTLSGTATDPAHLRDLYIFVNDQKVFFRTSDKGGTPSLDFSTEFPLKPGNNTVLVVAREDDEFVGRRTLIIHRGGTEVAAQMPK